MTAASTVANGSGGAAVAALAVRRRARLAGRDGVSASGPGTGLSVTAS